MSSENKRVLQKPKTEFSKLMCGLATIGFFIVGVWMVWRYYSLTELAITGADSVVPDAALPSAGVTFIFSPIVSYLFYQFGLKNSRNKYGVDENGQPYKETIGGGC